MSTLLSNLKETLLMGPGPSCVPTSVYKALAMPTIGHLDPTFIEIMNDLKDKMRTVLGTSNRLTIPVSGTGSAGMETCFVNLIEKDDPVLICINGVFGQRMQDVATRLGAQVDVLEYAWGTPVIANDVANQLAKKTYKIVAIVHAETSTGVCNPVAKIGEIVNKHGALYVVDAVTSFGGIPVNVDEWKIDALYSGTQKCLSCPPGLAPLTFSEKAIEKLTQRKTKVPNWYLDLSMIIKYWEGATRAYHHTAPINMIYGLYQAIDEILIEGIDQTYARHKAAHEQLVDGLSSMGLEMLVVKEARLPMLNAIKVPDGVNEAAVRSRLLKEYNIEIGAGLGPLAGKIWRIGLMGHTARKENVTKVLSALKDVLAK